MAATESSKALISHSRLLINKTVQIRQQLEWNSANLTAQTYMYTAKVLPTSTHHQLRAWPSIHSDNVPLMRCHKPPVAPFNIITRSPVHRGSDTVN